MKRKKTMKRSGQHKRRTGKRAHSYGKLENRRCLASVGLDVAQTCDIGDASAMVEQAVSEDAIEGQSGMTLRDRVVERLSNRDPSATPGGGAIREIAQRIAERRGEQASMEGLKELVSTAREDGEVTEEERAEIRELVSTQLAERGRDGSNMDPELQERRQERREERRERRGERASIEGLKELVSTAREDGEVTEEERAEIRELVSTELAERGRDGSNLDPERQERRQERREERREQRDSDVDSQRREQLRERISARRAVSTVFGRLLRG